MRWQDETPIHELIAEGAQIDNAYLTVARVGVDRKESQIGSQPINDAEDARAWLDRMADAALGDADDVRLRVRLWRTDRTPIRSVQTRVWPVEDEAPEPFDATEAESSASDVGDPGFDAPDDDGIDSDPAPARSLVVHRGEANPAAARAANPAARQRPNEPRAAAGQPGTAMTLRRPGHMTVRSRSSAPSSSQRVHARPVASFSPIYAPPCPTCAAATTTTALLQSRISELSSMLGAAQSAVRDSRHDAEQAQESARSRGRRAKEAEAEVARLRTQNADLTQEVRRLRAEEKRLDAQVADFYNSAVHIRNTLAEIDD